jgi:hypothetical protein
MRRADFSVLVACLAAALGCSFVKNTDDVIVGEGLVDSASVDSSDRPDTAATIDGSDATVDVAPDAKVDSSLDVGDGADAAIVDNRWALWVMPSPTPTLYDTSSTDVVIDSVTKLRWQKTPPASKKNAADAAAVCSTLSLGGTTGWRLPTRIELVSLLAFSPGTFPTLHSGSFPGTASTKHWTSSNTAKGVYVVDFANGTVAFALGTELLDFRCVHSP